MNLLLLELWLSVICLLWVCCELYTFAPASEMLAYQIWYRLLELFMWNAPPTCPEIPENPEISLLSNVLKDTRLIKILKILLLY